MISEAELRRTAARGGVDLMVLDLDYALGWFLAGLVSQTDAATRLIFKGGTCLRKCYFADYRFSEDLDFTLSAAWNRTRNRWRHRDRSSLERICRRAGLCRCPAAHGGC